MKIVLPIIGTVTVFVQLIRFWPFTFTTLLSALVTGGVFYIACKLGWDTQKGRILQDVYLTQVTTLQQVSPGNMARPDEIEFCPLFNTIYKDKHEKNISINPSEKQSRKTF